MAEFLPQEIDKLNQDLTAWANKHHFLAEFVKDFESFATVVAKATQIEIDLTGGLTPSVTVKITWDGTNGPSVTLTAPRPASS